MSNRTQQTGYSPLVDAFNSLFDFAFPSSTPAYKYIDWLSAPLESPHWDISLPENFHTKTYYISSPKLSNKLNDRMCSAVFPPSNISINKADKSYNIKVALAGLGEEDVKMNFKDNYLTVSFVEKENHCDKKEADDCPEECTCEETENVFLQKGIKTAEKEISFFIDPESFDANDITATMENGMLSIRVGKQERVVLDKEITFTAATVDKPSRRSKKEDSRL